jgi:NADH dehydrogenase
MAGRDPKEVSVVVVGAGFAGLGCARELGKHGVKVTIFDKNDYHQFQPMLYQVATAQVAPTDIATPLRSVFRKDATVYVRGAEVSSVDPTAKAVTCTNGQTVSGDYLVLAMGSRPNFFHTPGAEEYAFPLYTLRQAERLRARMLHALEDVANDLSLVERGALNFVIVGAGATGVETAGALADVIIDILPKRLHQEHFNAAHVFLVDPAPIVLAPFSEHAHDYASKVLSEKQVEMKLGLSVTEVKEDRVILSDGSEILTRTVIWAGGIQAPELAAHSGLPQGRGGRIDVRPDLTVEGFPDVFVLGDTANTAGPDGKAFPQLGSVALQAGRSAADNILADIEGKPRSDFKYHDKGIMAMIGRNAAIAEMGKRRHELHGPVAFAAWLGVHAWLLTGVRQRIDAFISWGWDYFSTNRGPAILDHPDEGKIDWGDPDDAGPDGTAPPAEPARPNEAAAPKPGS